MNHDNLSRNRRSRLSTPVRLGVAAVAACFLAAPLLAAPPVPTTNLPTNLTNLVGIDAKNIVYGAKSLDIVTSAARSAADVLNFNIATGYRVGIVQPSASANVLFRVLSSDPSVIYGSLSSNGGVYLVNPNGLFVGSGGQVDVARFVATTLGISNADFLAGRNLFVNDGNAKDVINQGEITTPAGGSVYLIGSNVSNEGIITTPQGETILAAGNTVSLIDSALPGVKVDITGAAGNSTNLGTITAEAGRIGIAGVIVRNSGTLNASSVVNEGGRIFLRASKDAYVDGNGRIVTTGTKGGSVEVLGDRVAVMDNASIDASGVNAGGTIKVGGDYQGKNPDIQNASITYFGHNASLKADATKVGDGGTVIVWSDDTTRAYGNISVRGGASGGNGGFVETSGKRYLDAQGIRVNLGANKGKGGLWLLDPSDIDIVASGTSDTAYAGGVFSYGGIVGTLVAGDINAALAGGDVTVQTDGVGGGAGNITATGVTLSGSNSLTLAAYGGGSATGNITITGSTFTIDGGINMLAGWNGGTFTSSDVIGYTGIVDRATIRISGSTIQSAAGAVNLWAGKDILLSNNGSAGTRIQGATMDVWAGNNLTLTGGGGSANFGPFGPGVMLLSAGDQTITAGNQILLTAGSADNSFGSGSSQYGGSVSIEANGNQSVSAATIKLWAGLAGHDNSASIRGGGATQDITVTSLLELKGGDGGTNNYANINAYGTNGVQTINASNSGANITLTGGNTGGAFNFENSADIGLGDANLTGSQTVYAGNITISGGSADWGGAGFGAHNGLNQSFYVSTFGQLTMTGGSADNPNFKATPAYIGSELGGGTIYIEVAGDITLTGGSGTAGGVLIGSLSSSPSTVTIKGYDVTIDGGEGGVGIGSIGIPIATGNMAGAVYIADGASIIADYDVSIHAKNSVTVNGILTLGCSECGVSITAGYSPSAGFGYYGGSISLGPNSQISGYSVNLLARGNNGYNGDIVQAYGGLIASTGSSIAIAASRNVDLSGMVAADEDVNIVAGVDITCSFGSCGTSSGYASSTGGDVFIRNGASILSGSYRDINISANVGYGTYGNGNVTQFAGSSIIGGDDVNIVAGGSVSLGGIVIASTGTLSVQAGYQSNDFTDSTSGVTPYGGDITLTPGSYLSGDNDVQLKASNGAAGYGYPGGNILQMAGSTIRSEGASDISIVSAGNTTLNGTVSSGYQILIGAGLDPLNSGNSSGIGGDITFGSGSIIRARNDVADGTAIKAVTSGGYLNEGHIIQAAGSQLLVGGYGDVNILAYGDARMDGTSSIFDAGRYGIYVKAGAYNASGLNSSFGGGVRPGSSNIVSIGVFDAIGGAVQVEAAGAILRSASNPNSINIAADSVTLTSVYGGSAGGIAISAFVQAANSITAGVGVISSAQYGGISIANFGAQPGTVSLTDDASDPGTGLGGKPMSIAFYNSGDLFVDANTTFSTVNNGDIAITSGGHLDYTTAAISSPGDNDILLGAGGNLTMGTGLTTAGNLGLSAGGILSIASDVQGNNVGLIGDTISLNNAGVTATRALAKSYSIGGIEFLGVGFIAGNVYADGSGAYLNAQGVDGDISGGVFGNITLTNGASFQAGNDIDLTLAGATSTLSLSNGSYFLTDYATFIPATIKLDFTGRSSGGIVIDGVETTKTVVGGSGFFVVDYLLGTPATEELGGGLEIKYASTGVTTDICAISPDLCKPPAPNDNPIDDDAPPPFSKPDKDKKASCEEGSFGCEENQANDGKKDEKPGERKVAQCSL